MTAGRSRSRRLTTATTRTCTRRSQPPLTSSSPSSRASTRSPRWTAPTVVAVEFKDAAVNAALRDGWHVWQRDTIPGVQREARTTEGFDTLIALRPERLIDLLRFEREATALRLDPALRFRAALAVGVGSGGLGASSARHRLERDFELSSTRSSTSSVGEAGWRSRSVAAWPSITSGAGSPRTRPSEASSRSIATAGTSRSSWPTARRHWSSARTQRLPRTPTAPGVSRSRRPARPRTTRRLASIGRRSSMSSRRASSRAPGQWDFRYRRTRDLRRHDRFNDRLAAVHRVDDGWSTSLAGAVGA